MSLRLSIAAAAVALVGCADEPAEHIAAKQTHLVQYQSCGQLEADLEDMLIREISAEIDSWNKRGGGLEDTAGEGAPTSDGSGGREEGVDFSGTNNQETGVDEADLVKTDGYHIYALNGHQLHIFEVPEFGQLVPVSATNVEGHVRQMLIDKDANRAVVFSYINVATLPEGHPLRAAVGYDQGDDWYWRSSMVSKITVFDMTNRADLKLVREVYLEGYYQTARKVGSAVNVSSYAWIDRRELWDWYALVEAVGPSQAKRIVAKRIRNLSLADLTPQMFVRAPDGAFTTESLTPADCRSYYRPYDSHARGFSSLLSFDLLGDGVRWDADHVVSNYATFYQSKDRIVLAEASHAWWWYWTYPEDLDQLNVHVFDSAQPGKATYLGSGRIEGMLSDQFAIDEKDGAIRLATTTGMFWRWWDDGNERPTPENHIWVLEPDGGKFTPVGHVGGIAKGERIMSARFMEDKAAVVTFRNIDPLFTIDLSDNHNPRLVGELKVPGFSTYIHPIGDHLLTIGVGGDDNGANWKTSVSLFDITDFANPTLGSSLQIAAEQGWSWSEALWEHKAFQYWGPKKLLAIPQSTYAYASGSASSYRYISKLELVEVDPTLGADGLRRRGAIDHSPYYMADPDRYWYYVDIRRSIFMGDYVYAISDKAISVHRTSDLAKVSEALLPGFSQNDWWWWW